MDRYLPFKLGELLVAVLVLGAVMAGIGSGTLLPERSASAAEYNIPQESVWAERIEYYQFDAATLTEVHRNMFDASPIVIDGRKYSGLMEWEWSWGATFDESGGQCAPDRIITKASSKITLPKWDSYDEASYADRREWDRAQKVLLRHEKKHETIAKMAVREFERKANRLPAEETCEVLTAKINDLFDRYMVQANTQNKAYDKRTQHGRTEGAVLRLPDFSSGGY